MKSHISVWRDDIIRKWIASVAKSSYATLCVLFLFSYAAPAQNGPTITGFLVNGVSATSGPVGATLTIQGSRFGATEGFSTATLNGTVVAGNGTKANSWNDTAIVVVIPTSATSGPVVVKVSNKTSNSVNFTVSPAINSLSPTSGEHGTLVTITGTNFATQPGNTVKFNGVASTISSWTPTKIVAGVPFVRSGKAVVTVSGTQSNGVNFTIAAPPRTGTPATGTFFVNRTDDPPVPVDTSHNPPLPLLTQFCQNTSNTDMSSPCSLREAVVEANGDANDTSTSPDTIMLGSAIYHLSIANTGTVDATTGHLDITNPVTIVGTGVGTIIQADASLQDQIFLIDAAEEGSIGFPVAISNLAIQGGTANPAFLPITSGGAFQWEAGVDGTGQLKLTNVNINGNTATDPGNPKADDGGGIALFNTASVTTPAQVIITNSVIQNNQALDAGGGIALTGATSLTMSTSTVSSNKVLGGGVQRGGGLSLCLCNNAPAGATSSPSFIQSSTISSNIAGSGGLGEGGAVYTEQSLTINQASMINGNSAGAVGGGIATNLAGANDQVVISSSTIRNNSTSGDGGGIEIDAGSNANLQLSFNRIVNNSVGSGSSGTGLANLGAGNVSATDNWWGCNQGPQTSGNGCDTVFGSATFDPWIVLSHNPSPSPILNGQATTLTASFLQDHSGAPLSAGNLGALIGVPISFTNAINGTLSNAQSTIQPNGTATATLTATAGPKASADATVDGETLTASVNVQDFSVSVSNVTVNIGSNTAQLTITVTSSNGFNSAVTLSCGAMPAGITCPSGAFNPPTVTPPVNGSGQSTLTVNIASTVGPGTSSIPVTGTSSEGSRSGSGNLTLADFSLSISPTSITANPGQQATYTVTCSSSIGFNGLVTLSTTFPGGVFSKDQVNCPGSATLTVSSNSAGDFDVPAKGTFGSVVRQTNPDATLHVIDFQLSISPGNQNVTVNGSINYTVTATSFGGFGGSVSLTCSGSLAGADVSCGNITIPAGGSGSTTLTVKTSGLTSPGNFQVFANGQSSGLNRSASAGIAVFDSRTWGIGGSITCCSDGNVGTFTLYVNGLSKTVTYCSPADSPILACEELGPGQPAVNSPATVTQALANAINGDSSSPATASIVNGALTLTAKTAGTFLRITSVDNGSGGTPDSLVGGPSVYTLDTANLSIGGGADGGCCGGGFSSTFTVFVSVNGSAFNFSESAGYCNPTNTPLPACEELGSSGVYSAGQIQQALVNAFNSDSASPVTAAITNNGLRLTAKTPGTLLNVASVDNGVDTTTGIGFTASQVLNVPNSVGVLVEGGVSANCCGSGFSTFTMTVNANGTNFSKSQSYCPPGTLPLPACKLSNGQAVEDGGTILQSIVNQFNSDSSSPVTAAINFGIVVFTAKTPGAVLAAGVTDDGGGFFSAEVGP